MIKYRKLPDDILSRMDKVESYLAGRQDVIFAYLFGGLAKRKQRPLSDVDIAVYLADVANLPDAKLQILGDLISVLQTDEIDLVVLNTASLPLRARVLASKRILVDKEPFFRHKYESLTLREYFDFSLKEAQILRRRFKIGG